MSGLVAAIARTIGAKQGRILFVHIVPNLLSVIIGYSDILLNRGALDAKMRSQCQEIKKAGDRAAALTRQLLAFSRQQIVTPRLLDLNAVEVAAFPLAGLDAAMDAAARPGGPLVVAVPDSEADGGTPAVMCDGSVRMISYSLSRPVMQNLTNKADGNVIDWSQLGF